MWSKLDILIIGRPLKLNEHGLLASNVNCHLYLHASVSVYIEICNVVLLYVDPGGLVWWFVGVVSAFSEVIKPMFCLVVITVQCVW